MPSHKSLKFLTGKLRRRYVWKRIFIERLTEPLHLNVAALLVWMFGSFRAKVAFDLVLRHHHAYGILNAADQAKAQGIERVALLEFGVGSGTGLLNMVEIARRVTGVTGVEFDIYGFDTGVGLPAPKSFRDHPELFQAGDFVMDVERVQRALPANASIIFGDVAATVPTFMSRLDPRSPVGFVSLDVDYYYSSTDALRALTASPEKYLPSTCMYLDDIQEVSHNSYCGELLAVAEFNAQQELRKIERPTFLAQSRVFHRAPWIGHIFTLHVLDHPTRTRLVQPRQPAHLMNPYLGPVSDSDGPERTPGAGDH